MATNQDKCKSEMRHKVIQILNKGGDANERYNQYHDYCWDQLFYCYREVCKAIDNKKIDTSNKKTKVGKVYLAGGHKYCEKEKNAVLQKQNANQISTDTSIGMCALCTQMRNLQ